MARYALVANVCPSSVSHLLYVSPVMQTKSGDNCYQIEVFRWSHCVDNYEWCDVIVAVVDHPLFRKARLRASFLSQ